MGIYLAHGITQNVYKQYSESWKMGGSGPHWFLAPHTHTHTQLIDGGMCADRQIDRWMDR
jgi:hypothetical protein